ncbi:MAG: hypothetical protein D6806_09545 [Deltaproteobacteria bacterium]|nr:MAG: hypothetical protein D6806_09545 [Deltaproteobacteria bacterium]
MFTLQFNAPFSTRWMFWTELRSEWYFSAMSNRKVTIPVLMCLLCAGAAAGARPPDRIVWLRSGEARYERTLPGTWDVVSLAPWVVSTRYDGGGEVFLEAEGDGEGLVVLDNREISRFEVWRVRVGVERKHAKADTSLVQKACRCEKEPDEPLRCVVETSRCLDALDATFTDQPITTRELAVVLTLGSAQEMLRRIQKGLQAEGFEGVRLAFVGANLMVEANVGTVVERRKLLLAVWRHMLGKLVLEDRITVRNESVEGKEAADGAEPVNKGGPTDENR